MPRLTPPHLSPYAPATLSQLINMGLVSGKRQCTFPQTTAGATHTRADSVRDSTAATNAIVAWLTANSAKRKPKTEDAIAQAERALWPAGCA